MAHDDPKPGPANPQTDEPTPAEPQVRPSSTPDGPATIPSPDPAPEGEDLEHRQQAENAGSSLDQPSG